MKKMFCVACCFVCSLCIAQQKALDSLFTEFNKHLQEDTTRLTLLNNIAFSYHLVNPDSGLFFGKKAIVLARKLKDDKKLGRSFNSTAINYLMKGMSDSARLMFLQAITIGEKAGDERLVLSATINTGIIYWNLFMADSAFYFYTKGFLITQRLRDEKASAGIYNNFAIVYRFLGNYDRAFENSFKGAAINQKYNDENGLANAYGEIGLEYRDIQDYDKALLYYDKSLRLLQKAGNIAYQAVIFAAKAQVYQDEKNYQKSLALYKQAIEASEASQSILNLIQAIGGAGIVYRDMHDYSNALSYLQKSNALSEQYELQDNVSSLTLELAKLYDIAPDSFYKSQAIPLTQRFKKVKEYLDKSLAIAKEEKSLSRQQLALEELSRIYAKYGDFRNAYYTHLEATAIMDTIFNDKTKMNITRAEMQYSFSRQQDSIKAQTNKQQALAKAEIDKQHIINNSLLAGSGFLLLAGFSGFALYKRNRDTKTKQKEAEFNAQVSDTEMKALRAQMNPHFIFNSLNSISDFMIKNDTQKADEYLTKFAKLMRLILENSEQKEVSVTDDLKALELYMQLEALRMQNKFTYEIKVADDIDKDNTLIPPLILQPFVENSIWHGLTKKNGEGKITIHIQKENNMLLCTVEDNGIGREEAKVNKEETKTISKKSVGLRITNARIDIINKLKNANATIKLSDLAEGTKAEVRLPLELSF